jgi:hypothetical protein
MGLHSIVHAIKQSIDKRKVNFIFHYRVPAGSNANGLSYYDCILLDKNIVGSEVPNLENDEPQEYADILEGKVYEETVVLEFDPDMTNQQKLTEATTKWNAKYAEFLTELFIKYKFYTMTIASSSSSSSSSSM